MEQYQYSVMIIITSGEEMENFYLLDKAPSMVFWVDGGYPSSNDGGVGFPFPKGNG